MRANTFPFKDGGKNAAILSAARNSVRQIDHRGSSFRSDKSFQRTNDPILRGQRSVGVSLSKAGSTNTQKLPRNLPKLDARNIPSLPQLGQVRRMPTGMNLAAGTNDLSMLKPRKLAPIGSAADKGKQLLNAGVLRNVIEFL